MHRLALHSLYDTFNAKIGRSRVIYYLIYALIVIFVHFEAKSPKIKDSIEYRPMLAPNVSKYPGFLGAVNCLESDYFNIISWTHFRSSIVQNFNHTSQLHSNVSSLANLFEIVFSFCWFFFSFCCPNTEDQGSDILSLILHHQLLKILFELHEHTVIFNFFPSLFENWLSLAENFCILLSKFEMTVPSSFCIRDRMPITSFCFVCTNNRQKLAFMERFWRFLFHKERLTGLKKRIIPASHAITTKLEQELSLYLASIKLWLFLPIVIIIIISRVRRIFTIT